MNGRKCGATIRFSRGRFDQPLSHYGQSVADRLRVTGAKGDTFDPPQILPLGGGITWKSPIQLWLAACSAANPLQRRARKALITRTSNRDVFGHFPVAGLFRHKPGPHRFRVARDSDRNQKPYLTNSVLH